MTPRDQVAASVGRLMQTWTPAQAADFAERLWRATHDYSLLESEPANLVELTWWQPWMESHAVWIAGKIQRAAAADAAAQRRAAAVDAASRAEAAAAARRAARRAHRVAHQVAHRQYREGVLLGLA